MSLTRKVEMPNTCANCWWASWSEYGLKCRHPAQIEDDAFTIDDDGTINVWLDDYEDDSPEYDDVCDLHKRSRHATYDGPEGAEYDAEMERVKESHRSRLVKENEA